jgi:molybdate transport system permease protein
VNRNRERTTNAILFLLAGIGLAFFVLPIAALLIRMPWSRVGEVAADGRIWQALRVSLIVSMAAVALALVFGFPIAWVMTRYSSRLARFVRVVVLLPMVLPPIVGGVVLLAAFGTNAPIGQLLGSIGIRLPFSTAGAVLAVTFVSAPFMVISLESGLRGLDRRLELAGATLGASRWMVLRTIVFPALRPALVGGAALTWARALGEFGATIAFAGNMPGRTQTLPLAIFQALETDMDRALVITAILVLITGCLIVFVRSWRLR